MKRRCVGSIDVLKVQLAAREFGIFFQMTNQLSTQSSIMKEKKREKGNIYCQGVNQTHSTFVIGILKHQNMMYLNLKKIIMYVDY